MPIEQRNDSVYKIRRPSDDTFLLDPIIFPVFVPDGGTIFTDAKECRIVCQNLMRSDREDCKNLQIVQYDLKLHCVWPASSLKYVLNEEERAAAGRLASQGGNEPYALDSP